MPNAVMSRKAAYRLILGWVAPVMAATYYAQRGADMDGFKLAVRVGFAAALIGVGVIAGLEERRKRR